MPGTLPAAPPPEQHQYVPAASTAQGAILSGLTVRYLLVGILTILQGVVWGQSPDCVLLEPNNTHAEAAFLPPGQEVKSTISYPGDRDFYQIVITPSAPNLKATLTDFEKNFNLWLLNDKGVAVAKANSPKKIDETIVLNLAYPDTYFLVVFHPKNGYDDTDCYRLKYDLSANQYRQQPDTGPAVNISPNPANNQFTLSLPQDQDELLRAELISTSGRICRLLAGIKVDRQWIFDIQSVPHGFYQVRFIMKSGRTHHLPLVILR